MDGVDGHGERYRLRRLLGEGGAGRVWLVEDRLRPGTPLALKEPAAGGPTGREHEQELRREFATLASLRHPNLVEVHEFDTAPGSRLPRFTLEFIEGRNIVHAIAHEGARAFLELAVEALRALGFLHDCNQNHRDLKPGNLLVRDRPKLGCRLVIVDFGLARAESEPLASVQAKGTLPYLAPELFEQGGGSRRSDLYALGAVLYEAVYGAPPFQLEPSDLKRFIDAVRSGRRSRPRLPPGYRSGLRGWFDELLSPDPGRRPATAPEALARLNTACGTAFPAEVPATRAARLRSGLPTERMREIAEVWKRVENADESALVWLVGGPGSGKSRVLRWLEADAMLRGWEVRRPGTHERWSVDELRALAAERPTLVLLDDVNDAAGRTVELLERVARERGAAPLRIVAALSPGRITHPALRRLHADTGTVPTLHRVELGRLDQRGIRAMACRATGGPVSDERVRWLREASEGVPAVAESLLVEGGWERGGAAAVAARATAAADRRLELLEPPAVRWLEALAVTGAEAPEPLLGELARLAPADARAAAEEAAASGLATRRGGRWTPDSRGLSELLLRAMPADLRTTLHRRAAEWIEQHDRERPDAWLLSRLWSGAGDPRRAVDFAARAAEQSLAEGDPAEAAARYGRALRLLAGSDRRRRRELRIRQGEARMRAGTHAAAARAFGAALRLSPDDGGRIDVMTAQATALVHAGRFRRALDVAETAARRAAGRGDREQEARARKVAGMVLGRLGREREAIPLLLQAREVFRGLGNVVAEAETVQALATCRVRLGASEAEADFREAIELCRRARAEHPDLADDSGEHKSRIGLAVIRSRAGDHDGAVELLEQVLAAVSEQGNLSLQEVALSRLASVAIDQGRLDRAIVLAGQAADLTRYLGEPNLMVLDRLRHADALIRCGRAGQAIGRLRDVLDRPLEQVEPENVDYGRMLLADAWIESGSADEETVRGLLDESLRRCRRRRKPRPLLMAMVIDLERRARPDCADPFEPLDRELQAIAARHPEAYDREIRLRADLSRAASRLARNDAEAARDAAQRAAREAETSGAAAFGARAEALLREALERLGDHDGAARALERGRTLLERAAGRIEDPGVRRDFLRRPVFRALGREATLGGGALESRLVAMYDMIRVLNSESDPEALLESILDMALRAVRAERGMILLKDERGDATGFSVRVARNLEDETVRDAESYSHSIVQAAATGAGQSLLAVDAGEDARFRDLKSVSLYGIRSLMCVPLRSRGRILGTVYLDSRRDGSLFGADDLRFLEAFADHAALALTNTRARVRLEQQNRRLEAAAATRTRFDNLIGRSPGMQAVFDLIEKVAATDLPVLIQGASGTGKELVARAIHAHGRRRRQTFLTENCAAIPETLLESELFGHVRGAFTGAERDRPGLFEQADGGTLLLDEIGDMSPGMQARLLRVLQEGELRRVGGESTVRVDVRLLAASHRDLGAEVRQRRFRQDLLYRIQVLTIELPPLRDRPGDIELLATHFLDRIGRERGRAPAALDEPVLALLERYAWPGNVRELENTIQRVSVLAGREPITLDVIESDPGLRQTLLREAAAGPPALSLRHGEREQIRRALEASQGNRRRAARLLGVSRATIYRKIRQHGL